MGGNKSRVGNFQVLILPAILLVVSLVCASSQADWPQWRGADRDGVWHESGLRSEIPADGLPVRWRVPAALGYAGPAVADGKVYLFEYESREGEVKNDPGARVELQGTERLRCLDAKSGAELWKHEYDRSYKISYPSGPRCTPTVDGDRVYILGAEGDLKCLRTSDGTEVWAKSFSKDYGAETPLWGHSAHPLVVGNLLFCLVGGEGSIVVAFDKLTGKEKWRALSAYEPGYCPPMTIEFEGKTQLVIFHPKAVSGLDLADGKELWTVPIEPSYGMSIAPPLLAGDRVFASGYNASVCLKLPTAGEEPEVLWAGSPKKSISSANSPPIFDGATIFGVDANDSTLVAVDPATGERLWETKAPVVGEAKRARHGTAFIVRQGETDRYWLFNEQGDLILARLSAKAYEELGRQHVLEPTVDAFGRQVVWSHPAFAEKAMFARNDKEIVCLDLSAE